MSIIKTGNRFTASFDAGVLVSRKWSSVSQKQEGAAGFESVNRFFILLFLSAFLWFILKQPFAGKKFSAAEFALSGSSAPVMAQKKNAFLPTPQFRLDPEPISLFPVNDIILYPTVEEAVENDSRPIAGKAPVSGTGKANRTENLKVLETKDGGVEIKGLRHFAQGDDDVYAESGRGWRPQGYCGPVAMQMVLDFYGVKKSRDYLALTNPDTGKVFRSDQYHGQMYIKGVGSVYSVMVKMAKSLGFDKTEQVWMGGELSELAKLIRSGRPQIVSVRGLLRYTNGHRRKTGGHIVLVRGFTAEGNLLINDPALHTENIQITPANFQAIWQGFSIDINRNSPLSGSNITSAR